MVFLFQVQRDGAPIFEREINPGEGGQFSWQVKSCIDSFQAEHPGVSLMDDAMGIVVAPL